MHVHIYICKYIYILSFVIRVSLSASLTKTAVAANAWKHGSHPMATGSSHLDSYMTRRCSGPTVCVRTLSALSEPSVYIVLMYKEVKVPCHIWKP